MLSIIVTLDEKPANVQEVVRDVLWLAASAGVLPKNDRATVSEFLGSYEIVISVGALAGLAFAGGMMNVYGERVAEWSISSVRRLIGPTPADSEYEPGDVDLNVPSVMASLNNRDGSETVSRMAGFNDTVRRHLLEHHFLAPGRVRTIVGNEEVGFVSVTNSRDDEPVGEKEQGQLVFPDGDTMKELDLSANIDIRLSPPQKRPAANLGEFGSR